MYVLGIAVVFTPGSSLPKSSVSPTPLLHIPEEDLPFPEAGLPSSLQNSPPSSSNVSPSPSLPSMPPQSHTPPKVPPAHPTANSLSLDRANSHTELSQRTSSRDASHEPMGKARTTRSSSIDIPKIGGGMAGALSKALQGGQTMGQKVKGLLSSLSSHDSVVGHVTTQPVLYYNNDLHGASPTTMTVTPTAGVIITSSSSSVEQGEFASMASPLSDHSGWLSSTSPPPLGGPVLPMSPTSSGPASPPPAYVPHMDTLAFINVTVETRYNVVARRTG